MPGPRDVTVNVTIKSINPLDFDVVPSPNNNPPLPIKATGKPGQPEIEFHNNGHRGFDIRFVLVGDTHGFFFPPSPKDACWSQCGSECPTSTPVWEVFEPKQVLQPSGSPGERRILIVHNANPPSPPAPAPQGKFMYNLRVTDGQDWKNLDPGGDNTDGSYGGSFDSYSSLVSIGTIALTTAVLTAVLTVAAMKVSLVCPVDRGGMNMHAAPAQSNG